MYRYIVVWGASEEAPSYVAFASKPEAISQAIKWRDEIFDADTDDWIDVLELNLQDNTMIRIYLTEGVNIEE